MTTNYDILIERELRHKGMRRVFGPGFYYGGIPKPQLLRGTFSALGWLEPPSAGRRNPHLQVAWFAELVPRKGRA